MQYLEIETPEGTRRVALARDRLTVGRLAENDVPLRHAQISRRHAELRRVDGEWWIRDLGSANGLHIGAQRVQQHRFAPGDRVLLTPDVALRLVDDAVPLAPGSASDQASAPADAPFALPLGPGSAAPQPWDGRAAGVDRPTQGPAAAPGAFPPGPLVSGGDAQDHYRRTMPAQRSPITQVTLHICQTCGQRTAPDVEQCHICHHSIARLCDICGASLLPIHERCPRCQTPNPAFVGRANRRPGG